VGIDLRTYLKKDKWFNFELEKIRDILLKGKLPQVKDMPDDDKSKKVILKLMKNNMKNKFAKRYKGYSSAFDTWINEGAPAIDEMNEALKSILDLNRREILMFAPIIVGVLWLGVYPNSFLDVMHVSVENLIALSQPSEMGQTLLIVK